MGIFGEIIAAPFEIIEGVAGTIADVLEDL